MVSGAIECPPFVTTPLQIPDFDLFLGTKQTTAAIGGEARARVITFTNSGSERVKLGGGGQHGGWRRRRERCASSPLRANCSRTRLHEAAPAAAARRRSGAARCSQETAREEGEHI